MRQTIMLLLVFIAMEKSYAQDPHFSQYHASPLTLSPAMTGYMQSDYRIAANFRTQYWSVGSNFSTGTFSYESKINSSTSNGNDGFAIGILGLYDRSSSGGFKSMNLAVSGAYHRVLDMEKTQIISVGFQAAFCTRNLSVNGLSFASQFTSGGFDLTIPNNENNLNSTRSYGDLNTGVAYTFNTGRKKIYLGSALYHISRPNISFYNDTKYKLPMRLGIHAGGKFLTGDNNNYVLLSASYMGQAKATDIIFGGAYGINLGNEENPVDISGGCWYRNKDAIIPYIGMTFGKYQMGITYDVVNSGLKVASPRTGGFELSMKYNGMKKQNPYNLYREGGVF